MNQLSPFHIKLDDRSLAVLDMVDYHRIGWLITRVMVPPQYRRQGWGSILMERACDKADRQHGILLAELSPYRDGGPGIEELATWLMDFGFKTMDVGFMVRFHNGEDAPEEINAVDLR